jgi:hypothetical protein
MSQKQFSNQWKQAVIMPVYTKGNNAYIPNTRPKFLLSNPSKVFELFMHDQFSYYNKNKFNVFQDSSF